MPRNKVVESLFHVYVGTLSLPCSVWQNIVTYTRMYTSENHNWTHRDSLGSHLQRTSSLLLSKPRNFQLKKAVCFTHQKLHEGVETLLQLSIICIYIVKLFQTAKLLEKTSIFKTPPRGQDFLLPFTERQLCYVSYLMSSTESWANPEYCLRDVRMTEREIQCLSLHSLQ